MFKLAIHLQYKRIKSAYNTYMEIHPRMTEGQTINNQNIKVWE